MYTKVGIRLNGPMHIEHGEKTLCGRQWYFQNVLGETYCQKCQRIYARRVKASGLSTEQFFELNNQILSERKKE